MNSRIIFAIVGIIVGLILSTLLSPMSWSGSMMSGGDLGSSRMGRNVSIDQHFIEQMIPHHESAIVMAKLALERAERPEVRMLAQAIVSAQEAENQQMKKWYREWFGGEVPQGNTMMDSRMSQSGMGPGESGDLTALRNAADFDKAFIEQMIMHHQMAIMMARMLAAGTERPEMRQLAENIIASQSNEIQDMQEWYADWY